MKQRTVPGRTVDRGITALAGLLAVVMAAFFLLPFAGLINRAVEDGRTWEVLSGATARQALVLSLWTASASTLLAIALGTPVAYALARARFRFKAVVDGLVDLPIVLPPTVAGVALLTAFGRRGLVGEPIEDLIGLRLSFTTTAVIMAQLLVSAPFYIRAARNGFASVSPRLEAVAYTLGASRTKTFLRVTVPQARPALLAGVVLCWSRAMGELGATLIFAGNFPGRTQTMPLAIVSAFEGGSGGLAGAIALSLMLLGVALVLLTVFRVFAARDSAP